MSLSKLLDSYGEAGRGIFSARRVSLGRQSLYRDQVTQVEEAWKSRNKHAHRLTLRETPRELKISSPSLRLVISTSGYRRSNPSAHYYACKGL